MAEYDVCEGFTLQHYSRDDWFPVIDARWWVREWLMCDETCEVEVTSPEDSDMRATWREVRDMLATLGDTGPYKDGPVFAELTYNHENDISDELLVAAGWVDVGEHALTRSPMVAAIKSRYPEHAWDEIGRVYVVAIAYGGAYGDSGAIADVYVSPNMGDDYDVARWQAQLVAQESAPYADGARWGGSHPIWDPCGGFGDAIDGLGDTTGYPYGRNDDRLPMFDVSAVTWDAERGCHEDASSEVMPATMAGTADGYLHTYSGPWLACGEGGVFAVGTDGRVHRVGGGVS